MKLVYVLFSLLVVTPAVRGQTAVDTARVYSEDQLSVVPVLLYQPPVVYPDSLKRAGFGGTVRVRLVLDRKGRPESTSVKVVSSPDTGLNAPARAAVLGSKFTAGHRADRDVRTQVTLPVQFDPLDTAKTPSRIYSKFDSLDVKPVLLSAPRIDYPMNLRERHIQGRVVVQMVIDTLGRPESQSIQFIVLPDPALRLPVLQSLWSARFRPARRGGRPVRAIVYYPVIFRM